MTTNVIFLYEFGNKLKNYKEEFNKLDDYFLKYLPKNNVSSLVPTVPFFSGCMYLYPVEISEVGKIIQKITTKDSAGHNEIPYSIFKNISTTMAPILK